jgi:tetratricopeptide (TPR) repeat protein
MKILLTPMAMLYQSHWGNMLVKKIRELEKMQQPVRKAQASGDIILAHYYRLAIKSVNPPFMVDTSSFVNQGNQYYLKGEYDKAIELYEMITYDTNYVKSWYNEGVVLFKSSRYSQAVDCFDKVLAINPNDTTAQYYKQFLTRKL